MSVLEENLDRLTESLLPFFDDDEQSIRSFYGLLRTTGSLIAGGSMLEVFHPSTYKQIHANAMDFRTGTSRDIDIYVPVDRAQKFLKDLLKTEVFLRHSTVFRVVRPTLYCQSFLNKNGIKQVITLKLNQDPRDRLRRRDDYRIDIMIVRRRRTPLQVVNNFDLTFCQTWCDGEKIYASHPDDVRNKHGHLQGEYIPVFLAGNEFLRRRIAKYQRRGYTIEIPAQPEPFAIALPQKSMCRPIPHDEAAAHWARRVLSMWISGHRVGRIEEHLIPDWNGYASEDRHENNIIALPFSMNREGVPPLFPALYHPKNAGNAFKPVADVIPFWLTDEGRFSDDPIHPIEEYDSEDEADVPRMIENALELLPHHIVEPDVPAELLFFREANILLQYAYASNKDFIVPTMGDLLETLAEAHRRYPLDNIAVRRMENITLYLEALKAICVRQGEDMISMVEDAVFDFHLHPLDGAVSGETLQNYLQQYLEQDIDRTHVPCYYHLGEADACSQPLTHVEIRPAVTPQFYTKYIQPRHVHEDLTQIYTFYDLTLQNEKKPDPKGFGEIYERSVCPFCLEFLSRDEGCAYMTHTPIRGQNYPYCLRDKVIPSQINRYHRIAKTLLEEDIGQRVPDDYVHLQSCIECGRACANHRHISLENDLPHRLLPSEGHGVCSGGGRAELYARILAIRQSYRENGDDTAERRRHAAEFADDCAGNPAWLARGRAILEMAEADRVWGNNNANSDSNANSNSNNNLNNSNEEPEQSEQPEQPAQQGGRRRTLKCHRKQKLTRMAYRIGLKL